MSKLQFFLVASLLYFVGALSLTAQTTTPISSSYEVVRIPSYSDEEYRSRIEHLGANFDLPLTYNNYVRGFINVYTQKKRDLSERILGLMPVYFPIFEEQLLKHGLPLELKYLAIQESALNQNAVSRAGATGLWQFMKGTAQMMGLKVTSYVDYRRDPYKASDAACRYLKRLHNKYGDWLLVIAAYNCGPGNVNKAMRRSGRRTYWGIYKYLPRETRGYVPAYISCVYWTNYYQEHNLTPQYPEFPYSFRSSDVVTVSGPLSLYDIATELGLNVEELKFLNPALRKGHLPSYNYTYDLRLPSSVINIYREKRNLPISQPHAIGLVDAPSYHSNSPRYKVPIDGRYSWHTMKEGDSLEKIAAKNNCSVGEIRLWNPEMKQPVVGDKVKIYLFEVTDITSYTSTPYTRPPSNTPPSPHAPRTSTTTGPAYTNNTRVNNSSNNTPVAPKGAALYTISEGDKLDDIAKWFGCKAYDLARWNPGLSPSNMEVGRILYIYLNGKEPAANKTASVRSNRSNTSTNNNTAPTYHRVKSGDSLSEIAERYNCRVSDIKRWNPRIYGSKIKVGQKIKLYTKGAAPAPSNTVAKTTPPPSKNTSTSTNTASNNNTATGGTSTLTYQVKNGDNLTFIADWYDCYVSDLKRWNNRLRTRLSIGQKIKVQVPTDKLWRYEGVNNMSFAEKQKLPNSASTSNDVVASSDGVRVEAYIVKSGDSLWSIAKKYPENTIDSLRKMNNLPRSGKIKPGMPLKIKVKGKA